MRKRRSMMDDVPRPPSVAGQAAEWLAVLTDASCTVEERQRFVEWLKRSNLHVDEFLRISTLTRRLTRSNLWPRHDLQELIAQAASAPPAAVTHLPDASKPRILFASEHSSRRTARARSPRLRRAFLTCATATLAVLALVLVRFDPLGWSAHTYSTSIGELRSFTLGDGSVVELNTRSRLRTRFTENDRRVELLRGEAIFKVAKNPNRPFIVATGSTEIIAVGTEFNVYARNAKTVVTVLEGRVRVTDKNPAARGNSTTVPVPQNFELAGGEQAVIAPHRPISRKKLADSRQVMSWTQRRLIFDDTPLIDAAEEFARYNTKHIQIEDPKLRELRVTGVFDATDPASLVQFVEAYGGVGAHVSDEGWTFDESATSRAVQ